MKPVREELVRLVEHLYMHNISIKDISEYTGLHRTTIERMKKGSGWKQIGIDDIFGKKEVWMILCVLIGEEKSFEFFLWAFNGQWGKDHSIEISKWNALHGDKLKLEGPQITLKEFLAMIDLWRESF